MRIGELAEAAGVAVSTVRYYERRGLLEPDATVSGQRRYEHGSLRRLVFIGLLQDAGMSLDDIEGVLAAESAEEWKAIGRVRLAALEAELESLRRARDYLAASLFCRYDHPLTECQIMGAEIDRRLDQP